MTTETKADEFKVGDTEEFEDLLKKQEGKQYFN